MMGDLDDLITWLRAQLDDDERIARQVMAEPGGFYLEPETDDTNIMAAGAHVYRWAPKRVLAEVEAKRRILDLHPHQRFSELPEEWPAHWKAEIRAAFPGEAQPYVGCERCHFDHHYEEVNPSWWCDHLCLLALPYADRPGYREQWRPA
jgi:hypothetical protein